MAQYQRVQYGPYGDQSNAPPPVPVPGGQQNLYPPPPPPLGHASPPPPAYSVAGNQQNNYYQYQQQQQQQQQQYQQPQYQQPQYQQSQYQPVQTTGPDYSGGYQKFPTKPRYNDLWAFVLFVVHLVGFIALAIFAIPKSFGSNSPLITTTDSTKNGKDALYQLIGMIAGSVVIGFILSLLYLLAMQRFAGAMIKVTFFLSVALYIVMGIVYFALGIVFGGIIMIIFGFIYAWMYFSWRSRIPFATVLLETVCGVTRKYGGTVAVTTGGLIVQVIWVFVWLLTLIGAITLLNKVTQCDVDQNGDLVDPNCRPTRKWNGVTYIVLIFCFFSFYWTSQVIKNILHVTVCGVFGTFYFIESPNGRVTIDALKRACFSAIGSICYGSLIIALIQTARAILRFIMETGDSFLVFLACIFECILSIIDSLVQYFNLYAFAQVAIYGKSFCQAGRDTWTLIKDRGVEAIINDNLIGNVLTIGMLLVGFITGGIGIAYLAIKDLDFLKSNSDYGILAFIACFVAGLAMMSIVTSVIESGVVSTFVALAEDPMALARTKPALFERIRQSWPDVVVGVQ